MAPSSPLDSPHTNHKRNALETLKRAREVVEAPLALRLDVLAGPARNKTYTTDPGVKQVHKPAHASIDDLPSSSKSIGLLAICKMLATCIPHQQPLCVATIMVLCIGCYTSHNIVGVAGDFGKAGGQHAASPRHRGVWPACSDQVGHQSALLAGHRHWQSEWHLLEWEDH